MSADVHVGDYGTVFIITIKDETGAVVDISSATTKTIFFTKPNGQTLTKTAVFTTSGLDGKIQYTTVAGDIDIEGTWKIQAQITTPGGEWSSDVTTFDVEYNLA